jgi:hypothetical protein
MTAVLLSEKDVAWRGIRFLDPLGRTFYCNESYYKAIYPDKVETACRLLSSDAFGMLRERGFVPAAAIAGLRMERFPLILKLDTEYFEVPPEHWGPLLLRDAALTFCDINLALLEYGMGLLDGHKGNFVVQRNSCPRWCDLGSIVPMAETQLTGLEEFIRYFVYPLRLRATSFVFSKLMQYYYSRGCSHEEAALLLGKSMSVPGRTRREALVALRTLIADLQFEFEETLWSGYHDQRDFTFGQCPNPVQPERHERRKVLTEHIAALKPQSVIDYGANAGFFSIYAAKCGAEVIAYELDDQAASKCHRNFRTCPEQYRVKVAQHGFTSHAHRPAELVLALALTHHLFHTHAYSFEAIARILAASTTKHLITEYMPNGLGVGKPHPDPLPPAYAEKVFLDELSRYFPSVRCVEYADYTHRRLILATK